MKTTNQKATISKGKKSGFFTNFPDGTKKWFATRDQAFIAQSGFNWNK